MVNYEKYHSLTYNLDKMLNYSKKEVKEKVKTFNQGKFLKKNAPLVYNEMKNDILYMNWLKISSCYIHLLKENNTPVGYVSYDIGKDEKGLVITHIYILKDYRRHNLLKNHLLELENYRLNKTNFILAIDMPNFDLIKALLKSGFISQIGNTGICMGFLTFFTVKTPNKQLVMTPFYDLNLFSPVALNGNDIIVNKTPCDIDIFKHNALSSFVTCINDDEYKQALKEALKFILDHLKKEIDQKIGDCGDIFLRSV